MTDISFEILPYMPLEVAKALGLRWYMPGTVCPHGHYAKRSISNRFCRGCENANSARRRLANPEKIRAKDREKYHRNPEKERRLMRANRAKHAEKRRESDKHRYWNDPERRAWQIQQADAWWQANAVNRGKKNHMTARRKERLKQATPPWLTKEHKKQIRDLYIEAATRPGEWHVDHIYPLRAKNSCGLNVPWNLQIISGPENRKKRNLVPEGERT